MKSNLRRYKDIEKPDGVKHMVVKENVFFGLSYRDAHAMMEICQQIIEETIMEEKDRTIELAMTDEEAKIAMKETKAIHATNRQKMKDASWKEAFTGDFTPPFWPTIKKCYNIILGK